MSFSRLGFIGLGAMGEPICRNLATRSKLPVVAYDVDPKPMVRLRESGVHPGASVQEVAERSTLIFLSLPSGEAVDQLARGQDGLLARVKNGQVVVDLGTSSVETTRALAQDFSKRGAVFMDAPVARTRAAAEAGTLSVMVGGSESDFELVEPLLSTFATDVTHCGPVGSGQTVKILNNMVLFETVLALAEAKTIAERAGVSSKLLFETFAKGSADSFALRNHGMNAMLSGHFPERAFSVEYARKDLGYALRLAATSGVETLGARAVDAWFERAIQAGVKRCYYPVISKVVAGEETKSLA